MSRSCQHHPKDTALRSTRLGRPPGEGAGPSAPALSVSKHTSPMTSPVSTVLWCPLPWGWHSRPSVTWPLPTLPSLGLYQCSSLHRERTHRPHPHLSAFCPSIKSMQPPLKSLPNPCQEQNPHCRDEDPCGASLGLGAVINETCKTQPISAEERRRLRGSQGRVHHPWGSPRPPGGR